MSLTPSKPFKSKLTKKNIPLNHPGRNTHTHTHKKKNDSRNPKKISLLVIRIWEVCSPFIVQGYGMLEKILDPNTLDSHGICGGQKSLWGMVISPVKLGNL